MSIKSVTYSDPENTAVIVVLDDGTELHAPWPDMPVVRGRVQAWLDGGNEVGMYVAPDPPPRVLSKLIVADRMSDAEINIFHDLRDGTAATDIPLTATQQRKIAWRWDNALSIAPDDPATKSAVEAVFGETRAAVLLAD